MKNLEYIKNTNDNCKKLGLPDIFDLEGNFTEFGVRLIVMYGSSLALYTFEVLYRKLFINNGNE